MVTQKKFCTFNHFDSVSTIGFRENFRLAWDSNAVYEGVTIRLFHFFMNKTTSPVLNACLRAEGTGKK